MKKFSFKLTLTLVSLFISIVLCALGNLNRYCLFFGLIMLAVSMLMFMSHKLDDLRRETVEYNEKYNNLELDDDTFGKIMKSIKKETKKLTMSFSAFALVMIIVAFVII